MTNEFMKYILLCCLIIIESNKLLAGNGLIVNLRYQDDKVKNLSVFENANSSIDIETYIIIFTV